MSPNTLQLPCESRRATRAVRIQRKEKWVVTEGDLGKIHPRARLWCGPWQMGTLLWGRKRVAFQARKVWGHRSRITQNLFIQEWLRVGKLLVPVCPGHYQFCTKVLCPGNPLSPRQTGIMVTLCSTNVSVLIEQSVCAYCWGNVESKSKKMNFEAGGVWSSWCR